MPGSSAHKAKHDGKSGLKRKQVYDSLRAETLNAILGVRSRGKGKHMFEFDLLKPLEWNIQSYLEQVRLANPKSYRVRMFDIFTGINAARAIAFTAKKDARGYDSRLDYGIPVAVFNKTIGDMKKVGIIGTAKGGEEVYLSDAAWELCISVNSVQS